MTHRPYARRAAVWLATASTALLVGACGGGDDGDSGDPTTGSSTSSVDTPSDSITSTDEGSDDTYADAVPAAGESIELRGIALAVPDDYSVYSTKAESAIASWDKYATDNIAVTAISPGLDESLESSRRGFNESAAYDDYDFTDTDPVTVDGTQLWHERTTVEDIQVIEAFGLSTPTANVSVEFQFNTGTTPPQRRKEVVESVMATVQIDLG